MGLLVYFIHNNLEVVSVEEAVSVKVFQLVVAHHSYLMASIFFAIPGFVKTDASNLLVFILPASIIPRKGAGSY